MELERRIRLVLLLFCVGAGAVSAGSFPVEFTDPRFNVGIDDWSQPDSDTGEVRWNPEIGDAGPGSLELSHGGMGVLLTEVTTPCFPVTAGDEIPFSVSIRAELRSLNESCYSLIVQYPEPNCKGEHLGVGNLPPNSLNEWERRKATGGVIFPGRESARISLRLFRLATEGASTCFFDDIESPGISVMPIDSMSTAGLLILTALLGLSGWLVLRKVH